MWQKTKNKNKEDIYFANVRYIVLNNDARMSMYCTYTYKYVDRA